MTNVAPGFYFTGDVGSGMFHPSTGNISLCTSGAQRVRIDGDGNVGVGESEYPVEKLHVDGNIFTDGRFFSPALTTHPTFSFRGDNQTGMYNPSLGSIAISTKGNQRFRLFDNGQIGVGSFESGDVAEHELSVRGDLQVSGHVLAEPRDSPDAPSYSWSKNTDTGMYNPHPYTLAFSSKGIERMRITEDGRVAINTNTPSNNALSIQGSVFATGDIKTRSDKRSKMDIRPIQDALHTVSRLRGHTYVSKDDSYRDHKRSMGLLAQDVESLVPEAVHYDGENDEYSINYQTLVALLIEAIKEMRSDFEGHMRNMRDQISNLRGQGR